MSTRSSISVATEEGLFTIYCHSDGYPKHHLPILENHYNTLEKAKQLIALGNLSILDSSSECPAGHSFKTPITGYCVAYERDRGEEDQKARKYDTWQDALGQEREQYNYLFIQGSWQYSR